jgi:hypothetical protein
VLAHTDDGLVALLQPREIEACGGSPEALRAAIERAVAARGLTLAGSSGSI